MLLAIHQKKEATQLKQLQASNRRIGKKATELKSTKRKRADRQPAGEGEESSSKDDSLTPKELVKELSREERKIQQYMRQFEKLESKNQKKLEGESRSKKAKVVSNNREPSSLAELSFDDGIVNMDSSHGPGSQSSDDEHTESVRAAREEAARTKLSEMERKKKQEKEKRPRLP